MDESGVYFPVMGEESEPNEANERVDCDYFSLETIPSSAGRYVSVVASVAIESSIQEAFESARDLEVETERELREESTAQTQGEWHENGRHITRNEFDRSGASKGNKILMAMAQAGREWGLSIWTATGGQSEGAAAMEDWSGVVNRREPGWNGDRNELREERWGTTGGVRFGRWEIWINWEGRLGWAPSCAH